MSSKRAAYFTTLAVAAYHVLIYKPSLYITKQFPKQALTTCAIRKKMGVIRESWKDYHSSKRSQTFTLPFIENILSKKQYREN